MTQRIPIRFALGVFVVFAGCSKSDSDGPKQVVVNGVTAPDCVELYQATEPGRKAKGNCAMAYFDAACTKTTFGIGGASTSTKPGGGGCEQTVLIVAKDYGGAREQFGYPVAANAMSKRERQENGYLPNKVKERRGSVPPNLPID